MLKANAQTDKRVRGLLPALAPALALLTSLWLALWPYFVRSESRSVGTPAGDASVDAGGTVQHRIETQSLLDAQGPGVLAVLAIPVVLAVMGATFAHLRWRWPMWVVAALLWVFCFLTGFSIGLFYFPALLALLVTAALATAQPGRESGTG